MHNVVSADGTTIAYDTVGSGPGLILVAGAFTARSFYVPLATQLSSAFTVITYDRRGRGDSTDTPPYSVEREWEDLAALQEATGARFGYADSSGVMVLLQAVDAGLVTFERLAVMEPPFRTEGAPPAPDRYLERLREFVAAGNPGGAAELFMVEAVGQPQEVVDSFKGSPTWAGLEALAPTLIYDALQMGDSAVPVELLSRIQLETLALHSSGSPDWLKSAVHQAADALPKARVQELPGQFHQIPPDVLVPALRSYFLS